MRNGKILLAALLGAMGLTGAAQAQTTTTTTTTVTRRDGKVITRRTTVARNNGMAAAPIRVTVDGDPVVFEAGQPMMVNNTVLVPIRGVFEAIGGIIHWNQATRTVSGESVGHNFQLTVGSAAALVNRHPVTLREPARLMDGTTYVPLRFTSGALGSYVEWKPETQTVAIVTTLPDGTNPALDAGAPGGDDGK